MKLERVAWKIQVVVGKEICGLNINLVPSKETKLTPTCWLWVYNLWIPDDYDIERYCKGKKNSNLYLKDYSGDLVIEYVIGICNIDNSMLL